MFYTDWWEAAEFSFGDNLEEMKKKFTKPDAIFKIELIEGKDITKDDYGEFREEVRNI